MKDEAAGEIPVAFVVRSNGSRITEDDVKQFISKQVMLKTCLVAAQLIISSTNDPVVGLLLLLQVVFYKRLGRVFFTDSIPKSPSGKILRKDLRAKLAADVTN